MRVSYGRNQLIVLLLSILVASGILYGVYHFFLVPIQNNKQTAQSELKAAEQLLGDARARMDQVDVLEDFSEQLEGVELQIPVGDIEIQNILATMEESASSANVSLSRVRLTNTSIVDSDTMDTEETEETEEASTPNAADDYQVTAGDLIEEEFGGTTTDEETVTTEGDSTSSESELTKLTFTVDVEGENQLQFQSFIRSLEQADRLFQVETISLELRSETVIETVEMTDAEEEMSSAESSAATESNEDTESSEGTAADEGAETNEEEDASASAIAGVIADAIAGAITGSANQTQTVEVEREVETMRATVTIAVFFMS